MVHNVRHNDYPPITAGTVPTMGWWPVLVFCVSLFIQFYLVALVCLVALVLFCFFLGWLVLLLCFCFDSCDFNICGVDFVFLCVLVGCVWLCLFVFWSLSMVVLACVLVSLGMVDNQVVIWSPCSLAWLCLHVLWSPCSLAWLCLCFDSRASPAGSL